MDAAQVQGAVHDINPPQAVRNAKRCRLRFLYLQCPAVRGGASLSGGGYVLLFRDCNSRCGSFLGVAAEGGFDTGNAVPRESGGAGLPALSGSLKLRNAVRFFLERNPFSDAETFAVETGAAESSGACLPEKRLINERFL